MPKTMPTDRALLEDFRRELKAPEAKMERALRALGDEFDAKLRALDSRLLPPPETVDDDTQGDDTDT